MREEWKVSEIFRTALSLPKLHYDKPKANISLPLFNEKLNTELSAVPQSPFDLCTLWKYQTRNCPKRDAANYEPSV